eukprot:TRINITY_DN3577_c0_g2_i1.p1 TRINITY_DN3577_c0_g2~~TRINITY_DN3577_c0_g2_i1.p1  ORF type:complete len:355 (+),score=114.78 TRINITY_DN3577_c0_g2_i1:119-1183(+)
MGEEKSENQVKNEENEPKEKKKWVRNNATWHLKPYEQQSFLERLGMRDVLPSQYYESGKKIEGQVPHHPLWRNPIWIFLHAVPALLIHRAWYYFLPEVKWHPIAAALFYEIYFYVYLLFLIKNIHWWMKYYGVFDFHNSGRDLPRDNEVKRLAASVLLYGFARAIGLILMGGFHSDEPPTFGLSGHISPIRTPFKVALWALALDFWFYMYHRAVHNVPILWKFHAKHHSTKHPTPLQAILADGPQEFIEIAFIPFLATLLVPMNSYELWFTMCTTAYVEALGHSGARAHWGHPLLHPILDPLGLALVIEDHDLHHRMGKSGKNYGKQSLVFDRLFGTVGERIESSKKTGGIPVK